MNSDCPELGLVSSLLDGELSAGECAGMLDHIKSCEVCQREIGELTRLRATLGMLTVDPAARERVLSSFRPRAARPWFLRRRVAVPLPLAAGIILVLGASVLGNAYLGLRQTAGGAVGFQNDPALQESAQRSSEPAELNPAKLESESSTAINSAAPGARGPVIRMTFAGREVEFVSETRYRLDKVPKIYAGEVFAPSASR